jgi:DMSO/TMAO reductase YedYZ molybdopterin-dependent catalytic subunit
MQHAGWRSSRQSAVGYVALERSSPVLAVQRPAPGPDLPSGQITHPFPFNAFYPQYNAPEVDLFDYRLEVSGKVEKRAPWTLEQLQRLPQQSQITRLICIEGWSAIGQWGGVPLKLFLQHVGADLNARYVGFKCADRYYSSIDMATALHPQTILALDFAGKSLPAEYGFPLRLRVPTKLGSKTPSISPPFSSAIPTLAATGRIRAITGLAVFSTRAVPVKRNRVALMARDRDRTTKPQRHPEYDKTKERDKIGF